MSTSPTRGNTNNRASRANNLGKLGRNVSRGWGGTENERERREKKDLSRSADGLLLSGKDNAPGNLSREAVIPELEHMR